MKRRLWRIALGYLLLFLQLHAGSPKAMIIFDASGSMWGQVDGVSKIVIARQALRDLLRDWNPKIPIGLTVYGHRSKGDCNDIETMIPIGPLDRQRMSRVVDSIQPKGKTPIARTLRQVAEKLRGSEDPATIILISDGKESCDADPCRAAKELKEAGINFVAHVIGFHVDRATDRQLACIAHSTGGEYFSARDAAALNKAIRKVAEKVTKVTTLASRPKHVRKEPANAHLIALYESDRSSSIKTVGVSGVHWWVWQDGKSIYADDDPLDHQPTVALHSGKATVKVTYPKSSHPQSYERNVTIRPGENRIVFYLKDGKLRIEALNQGQRTKSSVYVYPIVNGKADDMSEMAWCITSPEKGCNYRLPIGEYLLRGSCNGRKLEGKIEVKEGEERLVQLNCSTDK